MVIEFILSFIIVTSICAALVIRADLGEDKQSMGVVIFLFGWSLLVGGWAVFLLFRWVIYA